MLTKVYAVYACGCSLSVTCQVAMVNTIISYIIIYMVNTNLPES